MGIFDKDSLGALVKTYANFATFGMSGAIGDQIEGKQQADEWQDYIDNYERQDLVSPFGDLSVSTKGADMMEEGANRSLATGADLLAKGGTRSVIGGVSGLNQSYNENIAAIGAYQDEKQEAVDKLKASGRERMMGMQEIRETDDLTGASKMMQLGMETEQAGEQAAAQIPFDVLNLATSVTGMPSANAGTTSTADSFYINDLAGADSFNNRGRSPLKD